MADTPTSWIIAFGTLLTGSGGKLAYDIFKVYKSGSPKPTKEMNALTVVDGNLNAVIKARDELIEDNVRLRAERIEQDARHAAERQQWLSDQNRLRADYSTLEAQIRAERDASRQREQESQQREQELQARYNNLLSTMAHLRAQIPNPPGEQ